MCHHWIWRLEGNFVASLFPPLYWFLGLNSGHKFCTANTLTRWPISMPLLIHKPLSESTFVSRQLWLMSQFHGSFFWWLCQRSPQHKTWWPSLSSPDIIPTRIWISSLVDVEGHRISHCSQNFPLLSIFSQWHLLFYSLGLKLWVILLSFILAPQFHFSSLLSFTNQWFPLLLLFLP